MAMSATVRPLAQRCLLVLNPRSRNGDMYADTLVGAIRAAGVGIFGDAPIAVDALPDLLRRHGASLQSSSDRILVGGGDGTINRLLPQLVAAGLPVGIVPLGTANDLARTLGLPDDPASAIAAALKGRVVRIDLGCVNGVLFANVASIGLGTKVAERLSARLKAHAGVLGYPGALLSAYRQARPFRCRVAVDGGPQRRMRAIHLSIGNGRHYGGGALIAEDAAIDDCRLDLYALSPMPLWRLLLQAPWLKRGQHRDLRDVRCLQGKRISVVTSRPLPVSADGEIVARTPADFEVLPGALAVLVPQDSPVGVGSTSGHNAS